MPVHEKGLILNNHRVGHDLYEMEFMAPLMGTESKPGQFIHVRPFDTDDPLLRRPISFYDVDKQKGIITLLYKVVGKGTELMTRFPHNTYIDIMGPLGTGFTLPTPGAKAVLVGGGVGIAPLCYLCRELIQNNNKVTVLYGSASSSGIAGLHRFRDTGAQCRLATMDGSAGVKGTVTDILYDMDPAGIDFIYTCGPEPMMAAVADYAIQNEIAGEVSLEEHMACGVGACLGCARKLKKEDEAYVKICKDGPVFPIDAVELYR